MSIETRQLGSSSAPSTGPHYEDFWVGRRVAATHRPTTPPGDGRAGAGHLTTFLRLASDSGVLPASVLRVLETQWRDLSSSAADGAVEATFTVTGLRRIPAEGAGSVQWHALVRDGSGRTLQEGSITVLLPSLSDGSTDPAERDFCTRPWAEALARRLAEDEGFRSATSTWDGCIGLRAGGRSQVQLRIYRGRIIEVAARTPLGATFTLEAADHVWTDLMTGPSNDFFHRAMSGDSFTVTGNVYEYLRLSKALMALIDAARELAMGAHA
jgi:putative sterol carrier protein